MRLGWDRAALAVVLAILGLTAAAVGFFAFRPVERQAAGQAVSEAVVAAPVHVAQAVSTFFVPDPQKLFGKNHVRVLLVGLDYDYDSKDQETSKQSRSDIIMALKLDFRHHHIAELSVPRDMIATLPN